MSAGEKIFASIGVAVFVIVAMMMADKRSAASRPPVAASTPMRDQVMSALAGTGRMNATEVQRRLQVMLDAKKKGEYVDLIKLREKVLEAVREANALDDIADTAAGLDELPPEYEKIVYPNGKPRVTRASPEATTPPAVEPKPVDPLMAKKRQFFDAYMTNLSLYLSFSEWYRIEAPVNQFGLQVSGQLRIAHHETKDQRRFSGPVGLPMDVLNFDPLEGTEFKLGGLRSGLNARTRMDNPAVTANPQDLIFPEANWGALLGRFCTDHGCDKPFAFDRNPWVICVPRDKWFETRINIFRPTRDWTFREGEYTLRAVEIVPSSCEAKS